MGTLSVIGSAIGGYRILGPLGVGGTGAVYVAEHPLLGKRVAVKILHPGRAADEEAVAAFFADCTLARELEHPAIAAIHQLSSLETPAGKLPCVIGELLDGRTLAELLSDGGPLLPARAVVIAEQIASALETAHGSGLVHGALKSENVFLKGPAGLDEVKLLDFGTWRFHPNRGAPDYQAPQQRLGAAADESSDVYSLGALLHEMLTGELPRARPISETHPQLPSSVLAITERALDPVPASRFPTMASMLEALSDPSSYAPFAAPCPVPVPAPAPAPAPVPRRTTRAIAFATAIAAALTAAVTLAAAARRPASPPPTPIAAAATLSPDVTLTVTTCAPAARVYLDKRDAGNPGAPLEIRRGRAVEVTVRAHGFFPYSTTITPESDTHLEAVLLPRPGGPALL
jgi:serine/threonine-protein kinase